ncbi:MAG: pyridoxamine 5-phosphate oxidase-related, FMN-binding protein [Firmicutes bacterium]|nr:pyridoxamine 5-phosphate oxidase-related, FMN-binding protein [Bacillota bacterium]
MNEIIKFLQDNSMGFLATIADGKPKIRPFQFAVEENGKLFFCSNNTKDLFEQLKANPYVEFSSFSPRFAWIRINGEVKFSNDLKIKEKIFIANGLIRSIYHTPDNPIFEIFYIEHGTAILSDFSGKPPERVDF